MKRIRILFDAEPMVSGTVAGIGYYSAWLVKKLAETGEVELVGHYYDWLGRRRPGLTATANLSYRSSKVLPRQLVNQLRRWGINIPLEFLMKTRGDIILYPGSTGPSSSFRTPIIPVIHDLAYLDLPEQVSQRKRQDMLRFVPKIIKKAPFILTISESTKTALTKHYPWLRTPILVEHIPPALLKITASQAKKELDKLNIKSPFILFLGTLEPRKNIVGLLEAYKLLPKKLRSQYKLVLAGGKGWHDDEIRRKIDGSAGLGIVETGYISEAQRSALYGTADLFVAPSFYEGYGMPVAEAMLSGVAVAASNIPVHKEIAGDAALYFDPHDPEDISQKIAKLLSDDGRRNRLAEAGRRQVSGLSWAKVAESVLDQIKRVLR